MGDRRGSAGRCDVSEDQEALGLLAVSVRRMIREAREMGEAARGVELEATLVDLLRGSRVERPRNRPQRVSNGQPAH